MPGPAPPWRRPASPSRSVLDVLRSQGYREESARSRVQLIELASAALTQSAAAEPQWRWVVPGRVEIFGKHTDYAGGRSLVAAVPRGVVVVARERSDDIVRVIDARYQDECVLDLRDLGPDPPRRGWRGYVDVVCRRLAANFPGARLGIDIAIASDLPRAAGLSSSSALVVGVGSALVRRADLTSRHEWRGAIQGPLDLAAYFGCVENGSSFGSLAGRIGVGTEGGSEDHTAMICARAGAVSAFRFVPIRHLDDVAMPPAWRLIVASSGVRADKAGSVRERYNRASRLASALLRIRNATHSSSAPSLAAALGSSPDAQRQLMEAVQAAARNAALAPDDVKPLQRRLQHFVREDGRVAEAVHALRIGDAAALGILARASQEDAEVLLGNQVPETSGLVRAALDTGALAASSFGAGFGGSAWALVPVERAASFGGVWLEAYRDGFSGVGPAEAFVAWPAPPALELVL